VKETAKVVGNIFAPTVSILEGASFSSRIDMDGKKSGQGAVKDSAQGRPIRPATSAA